MNKKYLLVIEIKQDNLDEYIDMHKTANKQILKDIKSCGFLSESVWIYRNMSIVYFETAQDYKKCSELLRSKQSCKDWDAVVIPFFEKEPRFAEKVFDLNQQLNGFLSAD